MAAIQTLKTKRPYKQKALINGTRRNKAKQGGLSLLSLSPASIHSVIGGFLMNRQHKQQYRRRI